LSPQSDKSPSSPLISYWMPDGLKAVNLFPFPQVHCSYNMLGAFILISRLLDWGSLFFPAISFGRKIVFIRFFSPPRTDYQRACLRHGICSQLGGAEQAPWFASRGRPSRPSSCSLSFLRRGVNRVRTAPLSRCPRDAGRGELFCLLKERIPLQFFDGFFSAGRNGLLFSDWRAWHFSFLGLVLWE